MTCTDQDSFNRAFAATSAKDAFLSYSDRLERDGLSLGALLLRWHQRWQSRRALKNLSSELLDDIGLSEAQAFNEYSKPFWR
ncbi:MAG: DUF1127 domain-containing protein [Alphaproteobacteria bacterium]